MSTYTRLVLIRHGESTWNREGRVQGWADPPLSETGLRQAERLAERLKDESLEAIYASPLQRARVTAERIALARQLPVVVDDRLREHRLGEIQGLTGDEIRARFPNEFAMAGRSRSWVASPGEEPVSEMTERMRSMADELIERHHGRMAAVVSHGGSINRLLMSWLGIDLNRHPVFHLDNASLTIATFTGTLIQLLAVNDTSHLRADAMARTPETR